MHICCSYLNKIQDILLKIQWNSELSDLIFQLIPSPCQVKRTSATLSEIEPSKNEETLKFVLLISPIL